MMRIFKLFLLVLLVSLASVSAHAGGVQGKGEGFSWESVMKAIIHLESRGNAHAVNGQYAGVLQISPGIVRECNNIMKSRGSSKRYKLSDRYNAQKSKEMFVIFQSFHNPLNNIERGIRIWAGGIRYDVRKTEAYLRRVLRLMN